MNMNFLHNFKTIKNEIKDYSNKVNLIVVTKNQDFEKINHLIIEGHKDFGENKVQEAKLKWQDFLKNNSDVRLHFIGKLQSNKIKGIGKLFQFIHSLDSIKNAELLAKEEIRSSKKLKYFIQVNIEKEIQKSGIQEEDLNELITFCRKVDLKVIGLMCIPPVTGNSSVLVKRIQHLSSNYSLKELSMGMSNDYKDAISNGATYVRIGSLIFKED
jgi:pyridoxal phosphate enzyme (YggS family)